MTVHSHHPSLRPSLTMSIDLRAIDFPDDGVEEMTRESSDAAGGDNEEEWEEVVMKRRVSRMAEVLKSVSCFTKLCQCWCNWCCCAKSVDEVDMRTKMLICG